MLGKDLRSSGGAESLSAEALSSSTILYHTGIPCSLASADLYLLFSIRPAQQSALLQKLEHCTVPILTPVRSTTDQPPVRQLVATMPILLENSYMKSLAYLLSEMQMSSFI